MSSDVRLLVLVQHALLGNVPPRLRAVTCDWEGTVIKLRFVFDGVIDDDDEESARMAGTLVIADFASPWTLVEDIVRVDYPARLRTDALRLSAYERKEETTEGVPFCSDPPSHSSCRT